MLKFWNGGEGGGLHQMQAGQTAGERSVSDSGEIDCEKVLFTVNNPL